MQLLTSRNTSSRHDDRGFTRRKRSSIVSGFNTVLSSIVVAITVAATLVRSAVIFLVLLLWLLSLSSAASASPLSLYGPFDQKHNGERADWPSSAAYSEALLGCGRGRYRDPETLQCKGPADLR
jgi:hypothetical protein